MKKRGNTCYADVGILATNESCCRTFNTLMNQNGARARRLKLLKIFGVRQKADVLGGGLTKVRNIADTPVRVADDSAADQISQCGNGMVCGESQTYFLPYSLLYSLTMSSVISMWRL